MSRCGSRVSLLILTICQTACGGASTPIIAPPPVRPGNGLSYNQVLNDASALGARFFNPIVYTEMAQIPMSGVAAYDGYYFGELLNGSAVGVENIIGKLALNLVFSPYSTSVSGAVGNFSDSNNEPLSGQLELSHGALDRAGNPNTNATLTSRSIGSLTTAQGITLQFEVYLEGDLLGADHDAVGGNLVGGVTSENLVFSFDGYFIGER